MTTARHPMRNRSFRALRVIGLAILATLSVTSVAARSRVPDWVQRAAAAPLPQCAGGANAVVLLDEGVVEVRADGRLTRTQRYAARVVNRNGRDAALATVDYLNNTERVTSVMAWLLRPSGSVRTYKKRDFVDAMEFGDELYSDSRHLTLSAEGDVEAGCVFAWEATTSERTVFSQDVWRLQGEYPVVCSRYSVELPKGWRAEGRTFNREEVVPQVVDRVWTWEVHEIPALSEEPFGPSERALCAVVGVSLYPPEDHNSRVMLRPFAAWSDVSSYLSELADPQVILDDSITAKAAELTREAGSVWDKIVAIGRFAQSQRYVAIEARLGLGGGLTPHPAPAVLHCGYGDCKDKATLMRALLRSVGIDSYGVAVSSEVSPVIWEDWPSPYQFNHQIVAVRVGDDVDVPSVVADPILGRLVLFDPTDEYTIPGDLPAHYQGSAVLVMAGVDGHLVTVPRMPEGTSRWTREIAGTLDASGAITATVREEGFGQEAVVERRPLRMHGVDRYVERVRRWASASVQGSHVEAVRPQEDSKTGRFALDFEFASSTYAQSIQGNLLVFKPVLLGRRTSTRLSGVARTQPVVIHDDDFSEESSITLPEGFTVSELPESVEMTESFGRYAVTFRVAGGVLHVDRQLELRSCVVPVEMYPSARDFFGKMVRVEQTTMVLERVRKH